MYELHFIDTIP